MRYRHFILRALKHFLSLLRTVLRLLTALLLRFYHRARLGLLFHDLAVAFLSTLLSGKFRVFAVTVQIALILRRHSTDLAGSDVPPTGKE